MKNLAHTLLAIALFLGSLTTEAQTVFFQEDFNSGAPAWQSQSVLGPNQWNITNNGGNNIDGTDMVMIQSLPGQPSITELVLPPFPPVPPGTQDVVLEMEINLVSEQNMVMKLVQFDDQNPGIPIELEQLDLTSCDPILPWNCPLPEQWIIPLDQFDPNDTYVVVCEDLSGSGGDFCAIDNVLAIANPCPIGLILDTNYPPTCHNGPDGLIEVTGILGEPPYTYSIDFGPGQASGSFNTFPGVHLITVVDAIGCTTTITVVVPNKPDLIYNYVAAAPSCFDGNDATIVGSASGGTPGYTYTIDGGPAQGNGNFTTTPGVHNIMVIDALGCTKVFALTVPNADPIGIQQTVFPPTCHDGDDGQISVTASGGTPPYSYSLDGGLGQGNGNFITTPGAHTVTVTDANNCTKVFTITVPNSTNEIIYNYAAGSPTCHNGPNGAIAGAAAGGTPPYSYSLNFGLPQGNGAFLGLSPGWYTITITDALGCQTTHFIEVPNVPELVVNFTHSTSVSCFNGSDAIIQVTSVANGTPPYTYTMNGVAGGPTWLAAPSGNYVLVVTDANGCTKTENFTIANPPQLTITGVINHVTCSGAGDGIITPFPGGGTPPYQTRLDGGAYAAPVNYTDLSPGLHSLDVKDANACVSSTSVLVTQPLPLVSDTVAVTPSSGDDGAIDIETVGGNPAYFYLWSNGETTQDIDSLPSGEYYVLTTDTKLCPSDTLWVTVPSSVDPTACVAENFTNAPTGLFEDQTIAGGTKTRLNWDHYSDASEGCILKGGKIDVLDPSATYSTIPGQVLIQGVLISGISGLDFSASLDPNATFDLFDASQYPTSPSASLIPGAFYKWQVQCGCIIDNSLPFPAKLQGSNLILSPWSEFDVFTNLSFAPIVEGGENSSIGTAEQTKMLVYPNPNEGNFVLSVKGVEDESVIIEVRNSMGELIDSFSKNIHSNNQLINLDISHQNPGMYLIQIHADQFSSSTTVIKK
ncbi:MAG: T9SS type A sorting domain-containing protein [Flavobacteriales bacterium]|nr:T9SS type A sorting domain-containing protein [Flavobacteriales bacterium]